MFYTILICLSVFLTGLFLLLYASWRIAREKAVLSAILHSYFEPRSEDKSSEFADLVNVLATINAEKVTQSLKGTFMNIQSVDSRQAQAIKGDFIQDIVTQQNPILGVLLDKYPAVKKRLAKNPELMGMVSDIGTKLLNKQGRAAGGNHGKDEFKFQL